jgi:hypothetical protein
LESFNNNGVAKDAVWLILTKFVFRPDNAAEALSTEDAKLYASIISQRIPLIHNGDYSESKVLFEQYRTAEKPALSDLLKAPSINPAAPGDSEVTPKSNGGQVVDFGPGAAGSSSTNQNKLNDIDYDLLVLNRDLKDVQQKLYMVKLIESGMLMKGFLSPRDNKALETISVELGLAPDPKHPLKDNDPRMLVHSQYLAMRDGLYGEVRKKAMLMQNTKAKASATSYLTSDKPAHFSGEIILEDFFSPEEMAINQSAKRIQMTGLIDQKDYDKFDAIAPYLEGKKTLPPTTDLPPGPADGSKKAAN